MSNADSGWIWSDECRNYYYVTYDEYGRPVYHWNQQIQPTMEQGLQNTQRHDSGYGQDLAPYVAQMPDPAPYEDRVQQGFISGTPGNGWYDLDASYRMRTGPEAHTFFVDGRVFAMLYTETASETSKHRRDDDAYTVVRFRERAYTNIRRFVVVERRRGFVYAIGIGTYSGRGALKVGCAASEHAIVYLSGTDPSSCYFPGEYQIGMTKEPIEIVPTDSSIELRSDSRIRFGKTYPIEMNVKVKDIGRIHPSHMSKLLQYWNDEK